MTYDLDRRTLLGAAACAGCLSLAAACGSDKSASPAAAGSSTPAAAGTTPGSAAPAAVKALAQVADIPQGGAVSATSPTGAAVILSRTGPDTVVGFSARCTHMGCTVAPSGAELDCPCHGSRYSAKDGTVLQGPAPRALAAFPVKVVDGAVLPA